VELANRLYDAGRYAEAIPYYQQAFTLDSTNVNVSTDLATALYYAGRVDEALAQFDDHWRSIRGMGRPSTTWGSSNATPRAIGRARLPRGSACSQAIPIIRMRRKCARCWPS
jgi:tetratricopeptide (TPR) repeat protein